MGRSIAIAAAVAYGLVTVMVAAQTPAGQAPRLRPADKGAVRDAAVSGGNPIACGAS